MAEVWSHEPEYQTEERQTKTGKATIRDENGFWIATCIEEDAALIAEAPAMLEALREINADYRDDDGDVLIHADENRKNELADRILAILARIDGEA